jgi:hypothetical protein
MALSGTQPSGLELSHAASNRKATPTNPREEPNVERRHSRRARPYS